MATNKLPVREIELLISDLNNSRSTIKFEVTPQSFSNITQRLRPYKRMPYLFKPALEKLSEHVRAELIPRTFKQEGPGWKPLARRTIAERIQAGYRGEHPILRRSGDLFKELTNKSHPKHIEIIKTGKNARIEIGGSSAKFIENQRGMGAKNLPARPMVPGTGNIKLSIRDRLVMRAIIMKAVREKIKK